MDEVKGSLEEELETFKTLVRKSQAAAKTLKDQGKKVGAFCYPFFLSFFLFLFAAQCALMLNGGASPLFFLLTHTHPNTLTQTHSHTLTHPPTLTHSLTHSLTHTHTYDMRARPGKLQVAAATKARVQAKKALQKQETVVNKLAPKQVALKAQLKHLRGRVASTTALRTKAEGDRQRAEEEVEDLRVELNSLETALEQYEASLAQESQRDEVHLGHEEVRCSGVGREERGKG